MLFLSQPDPPPTTPTPQKSLRIFENLMGAFFESGWVWTHPNPPVTPPLVREEQRGEFQKGRNAPGGTCPKGGIFGTLKQ